ncbi:pilus assembly protein [Gibbsiella quercinecans]|uniref:fimbrial protein n=1 Tax=Gibbsiella quercinecans TaxID=929813 RepID=UPI000EF1A3D4|nr:fimbrial protein [Gibbsiella quercinecans]RLM04382.1 pilus assembly protein [Gibbsiella quercinecans]
MFNSGRRLFYFLFVSLPFSSVAVAADNQGTPIVISGTVVAPPPCVINEDRTIDVEFGTVGVNKIDGNRYMQRLNYTVKCEFLDSSKQLQMKIVGSVTSFDASAITTNVTGLGIRLLANGNALTINSPFNIDYTNLPALDAVPVKSTTATLAEGEFTSGATMLVDYF